MIEVPYVVELPGTGYLGPKTIKSINGLSVVFSDEVSILPNPSDAHRFEYDVALEVAEKMNDKEDHKKWKAVAYSIALSEWIRYGKP